MDYHPTQQRKDSKLMRKGIELVGKVTWLITKHRLLKDYTLAT